MKNGTLALASFAVAVALLLAAPTGHAQAPASSAGPTASAVLHADQPGPVVNKNIYGHFAEHLGRGIYEGIWVGPGLPDPEHARDPQRRRRRAQGAEHPRAALAGRLLRRRVPLEGRDRPAREAPVDDQHPLGRSRRGQQLRHPRVHGPRGAARHGRLHHGQRRQRHPAGDDGVGRVHDLRRHLPDGQPAAPERPREGVEGAVLRRRQRAVGLRRQHARRVLRRRVSASTTPSSRTTTAASPSPASRPAPTPRTTSGPRC